jgi:hypothetical protein
MWSKVLKGGNLRDVVQQIAPAQPQTYSRPAPQPMQVESRPASYWIGQLQGTPTPGAAAPMAASVQPSAAALQNAFKMRPIQLTPESNWFNRNEPGFGLLGPRVSTASPVASETQTPVTPDQAAPAVSPQPAANQPVTAAAAPENELVAPAAPDQG